MAQYLDKDGLIYYTSKVTGITTDLQDQIDNLKAIGRFLSNWNCETGLPTTTPPGLDTGDVFEYKVGDYYLVSNVASSGGTNYKPNGSTYIVGTPSTTIETDEVAVGDMYIYDSQNWLLLYNTKKTVAFVNIAGDPYDNSNLASALNEKQDELPSQTGQSGKFLTTNGTAISWGDAPVTDVQINSTSILSNGVANIPVAYNTTKGVVLVSDAGYGIKSMNTGQLQIHSGDWAKFSSALTNPNQWLPIVTKDLLLGMKVFLGTTITSTTSNTTWNDTEKASARNTLGCTQAVFVDWSN